MAIRKGFTLIEISITVVILALLCSGMLGIFAQGFSYLKQSKERTIACNLAREVMERYFDWSSLSSNPPPYSVTLNNITYNVNLTISDGPVSPNELKQLDVNISWPGGTFNISTLKANY